MTSSKTSPNYLSNTPSQTRTFYLFSKLPLNLFEEPLKLFSFARPFQNRLSNAERDWRGGFWPSPVRSHPAERARVRVTSVTITAAAAVRPASSSSCVSGAIGRSAVVRTSRLCARPSPVRPGQVWYLAEVQDHEGQAKKNVRELTERRCPNLNEQRARECQC